jgi:hypothetical protein
MTNDQFHYGLYPFPNDGTEDEVDRVSRAMAELVPVTEYAGFRIENRIIRSHLMMTRYTNRLRSHPEFISVSSVYEALSGISLEDHEALTFGLFTRCNMVSLAGLRQNSLMAAVRDKNFYMTAIRHETVRAFFAELTATPAELSAEIDCARKNGRDHGVNDLTIFHRKPLITERYGMLPVDVMLVMEKFETGPYWRVNDRNRETGDKLRRFWGPVFESYVNDQVAAAAAQSGATFIADPRWAKRSIGPSGR